MKYEDLEVGQGILYNGPKHEWKYKYLRVVSIDAVQMRVKLAVPEGYYHEAKVFYVTPKDSETRVMKIDWNSLQELPRPTKEFAVKVLAAFVLSLLLTGCECFRGSDFSGVI